jgi:hypothetical protein
LTFFKEYSKSIINLTSQSLFQSGKCVFQLIIAANVMITASDDFRQLPAFFPFLKKRCYLFA